MLNRSARTVNDGRPTGGNPWPVGVYLVAMALVTIAAVLLAAETKHRDLDVR